MAVALCGPEISSRAANGSSTFAEYQVRRYEFAKISEFGVTRRRFTSLRFGETEYHLRRPVEGSFYPGVGQELGEFCVRELGSPIVGKGRTPERAYQDWLEHFHVEFQRLYAMRAFEMDDSERQIWRDIEDKVDVARYRMEQPLIVRQQGTVVRARPYPEMVRWEDGTREKIVLRRMPGEFATYKPGQPFEAIVHRDPLSHQMIKVDYVKRLFTAPEPSDAESKLIWDSLPTSGSLPDTAWD